MREILSNFCCAVGGGSGVPELQLEVTSTPPVAEGHSFSIYLSSSGVCLEHESLSCLWTRNGGSVCSEEEGSAIHSSPPDRGYAPSMMTLYSIGSIAHNVCVCIGSCVEIVC